MLLGMGASQYSRDVIGVPDGTLRQRYLSAIADGHPDLVHVNGTEYSYGTLIADNYIDVPAVVSLQGLLGPLARFDAGGIALGSRVRNSFVYDLVHLSSLVRGTTTSPNRVRDVEQRILRSNAVFVGRTMYDRACVNAENKDATYYHCDEVMRPPFYDVCRDESGVVRNSIVTTGCSHPRKGFHSLLRAIALVKPEFPDIIVRVPGQRPRRSWRAGWYERLLRRLMEGLGLEDNLVFLGSLNAGAMAAELARAHICAVPSFADNSPNALAEAMLVGVPTVASYVGGIPSMVRDQETALCFPVGDHILLAECIRRLLHDDKLARRLGDSALALAKVRHDPKRVGDAMLGIYRRALGGRG
jgi:glycosyltransferase involved in cell wall biosynthesis